MALSRGEQIVVLSDVHIGNNHKTCWYQKDVHEPYLEAILDWIIMRKSPKPIGQLVLLGDLVDFWTCPGNVMPPTFAEIVNANPLILGPDGKLCQAIDALDGEVYYLTGNHDMSVTKADIDTLVSPQGRSPHYIPTEFFEPTIGDKRLGVTMGHGHYYTLFNAPDRHTPWAPMPVGHFVTRMVASMWQNKLKPGQTVADLPGQGSPNGSELVGSFLSRHLLDPFSGQNASISSELLNTVAAFTGWNTSDRFVMPSGHNPTLAEVETTYAKLWNNWVSDHGDGDARKGRLSAFKAGLADAKAWYLGWFAQQVAFGRSTQQVVFGHTHEPISEMQYSIIKYINSGFQCPSVPDMAKKKAMSFGVIASDPLRAYLQQAKKDNAGAIKIENCQAGTVRPVPPPAFDYSCYVSITNKNSTPVELHGSKVGQGYYAVPPPQTIAPGETKAFWITDYPSLPPSLPHGSDCTFAYKDVDNDDIYHFGVDCPPIPYFNKAWGPAGMSFVAKSGDPNGAWGPPNTVPSLEHPLCVEFSIDLASPRLLLGVNIHGHLWTRVSWDSRWLPVDQEGIVRNVTTLRNGLILGTNGNGTLFRRDRLGGKWSDVPGQGAVYSVAEMLDGRLLGTNYSDLFIKADLNADWTPVHNGGGGITSVAVMPDGTILGADNVGDLWTRATLTSDWHKLQNGNGVANAVSVMRDGTILGASFQGGNISVRKKLTDDWVTIPDSGDIISVCEDNSRH